MTEKKGIGGWLLLPSIGIALNPLVTLLGIVALLELQSDYSYRLAVQVLPVIGTLVGLELLGGFAFLIFSIVLAVKFFRKRQEAPSLVVWFLALITLYRVLLWLVSTGAWEEDPQLTFEYGFRAGAYIISCMIWIPYFKLSKRVRATFVN